MHQALTISAPRFWRERPQEVLLVGAIAIAGMVALGGSAWSTPTLSGLDATAEGPPAPPPLLVRQLAPQDAAAINGSIPLAGGANPAAKPFALVSAENASRGRALECLTSAIYYEAGNEPADGQRAVAQVVLNRVRHPAFPASLCGVVYEGSTRPTGCQFTFTCDGSLARPPSIEGWSRAREIAQAALSGFVYRPVGNATHYHANYVVPYWASTLTKNAVVGAHIFYRWAGSWGQPGAFAQRYSRREPNTEALRAAAMLAEQRDRQQQLLQGTAAAEAIAEIPGAEALPLKPSMRGDKRVAIRFNLMAREAAEAAPREEYVEKVKASENLRWTLTGGAPETEQKPFGRPEPAAGGGGAGGGSVGGGAPQ